MRALRPLALLAPIALASPALAEPPFPTTDFSGTWIIHDGGGNEFQAEMAYSATDRSMRMDMAPGGVEMHAIRDMETGEMVMWSAQMPGMGLRLDTPKELDVSATATGETRTVNGESCEVWKIESGTACLAEGNVPLQTEADGVTAELTDVARGPQDESLFSPPPGLSIMTVKGAMGMMKGMDIPQLPF